MKRLFVTLFGTFVVVSAILYGLGFQPKPSRGTVLAIHDGVPIFYHRGEDVRGRYGLEYECVEFVNRWLAVHGNENLTRTGNAVSYYDEAKSKGLTPFANGGVEAPKWGDVIVFSSTAQSFGHVGIVVEVGQGYIWVAQQNASIKLGPIVRPLPYEKFTLRQSNGRWTVRSRWPLKCLGWSRPAEK